MTQPNPNDGGGNPNDGGGNSGGNSGGAGRRPTPVKVLDVVEFVHHDHLTGREHRRAGVVVDVEKQKVTVRPLDHYTIEVDPADVTPHSPDDV